MVAVVVHEVRLRTIDSPTVGTWPFLGSGVPPKLQAPGRSPDDVTITRRRIAALEVRALAGAIAIDGGKTAGPAPAVRAALELTARLES